MFGFAEVAEVEEWPARSPRAACVLALVPLVSFLILVYAVATGRRWKMDKRCGTIIALSMFVHFHATHWSLLLNFGREKHRFEEFEEAENWTILAPFAVFAASLVHAASQAWAHNVTSTGVKNGNLLAVPLSVPLLLSSYYGYGALRLGVEVPDTYGTTFRPSHLCFWLTSMCCQIILIAQLGNTESGVTGEVPTYPMCLAQLLILTSALGRFKQPDSALSALLELIAFASFYPLLIHTTRPLRILQDQAEGAPRRPKRGRTETGPQKFLIANRVAWLSWHAFPLVYLLGRAGVLTSAEVELGYVGCDFFVYMPVAAYLAILTR